MAVLDASAAVSLVRDGLSNKAGGDIARIVEDEEFVAPSLLCVEVAQVAWKYQRAEMISVEGAQELMRIAIGYVDEFVEDADLLAEAYREAVRLNHSVYDMLYFVLARRKATVLVTCDRKLAQLCEENGVGCALVVRLAE